MSGVIATRFSPGSSSLGTPIVIKGSGYTSTSISSASAISEGYLIPEISLMLAECPVCPDIDPSKSLTLESALPKYILELLLIKSGFFTKMDQALL